MFQNILKQGRKSAKARRTREKDILDAKRYLPSKNFTPEERAKLQLLIEDFCNGREVTPSLIDKRRISLRFVADEFDLSEDQLFKI